MSMTNTNNAVAIPKREIQDDFTPMTRTRSDDLMKLWAPEIEALLKDSTAHGKVAVYKGVPAHVATKLRKEFPQLAGKNNDGIRMRDLDRNKWLDKDGNPVNDKVKAHQVNGEMVENPAYNTGSLEIKVPVPGTTPAAKPNGKPTANK